MLMALVAVFVVLGVMQYFMPKPKTPPDKGQQTAVAAPADAESRGSSYSVFHTRCRLSLRLLPQKFP